MRTAGCRWDTTPYGSGYVYDTYGNLDAYTKTGGGTVNFDYDSFARIGVDALLTVPSVVLVGIPASLGQAPLAARAVLATGDATCVIACRR